MRGPLTFETLRTLVCVASTAGGRFYVCTGVKGLTLSLVSTIHNIGKFNVFSKRPLLSCE